MTSAPPLPVPVPDDVEALQQIHSFWNNGNQPAAIDLARSKANEGRAWAAALTAWLLAQQGQPGIVESVDWAITAARLGAPWQATHTFNNAIGYLPTYPQLAQRLPELLQWATPWQGGIDLIGHGWNVLAQGQPQTAAQIMMMTTPWPLTEPQWDALVRHAAERNTEVEQSAASAQEHLARLLDVIAQAQTQVEQQRDELTTNAKQAGLLVNSVIGEGAAALFDKAAERNKKDSRGAWRGGLVVLGIAAFVAVMPVVLNYVGAGAGYDAWEKIAVHIAATAALGTFAGVLLARGRSRDQAAQRASDLSTAMSTMINYSNQISDPAEKQRFMLTMGQAVLQAHLASGAGGSGKDDSTPNWIALAGALRQPTASAPTST